MKRRTLLAGAGGVLGCSLAGCSGQSSAGSEACEEVTLEPDIFIRSDRAGDARVSISISKKADGTEEMVYEESVEVMSGVSTTRSRVFSQFLERGTEPRATYTLTANVEDGGSASRDISMLSYPQLATVHIDIGKEGVEVESLHSDRGEDHKGLHEECYWEGA